MAHRMIRELLREKQLELLLQAVYVTLLPVKVKQHSRQMPTSLERERRP
ncbi:MAG TPA: hypothetical protein VGA01_21225 [Candidatus Binatia bacterium]